MASEIIYCANQDHCANIRAVARLSWPNGPYKPTTACAGDLHWMLREARTEGVALLIEPIARENP
jgi:hypothetical protein